jgi:signal recognition particle receptor subunit beta
MVLFNYSTRELTAKIVYYGPGLCGKTTNLQFVYSSLPDSVKKGKMLSLATKTDRTLFFDFLPIELGTIRGMRTRVQLYTVPGQVFYNSTRKLVLKGADGVVFVADSQAKMTEANIESYRNLEENLREMGIRIEEIPLVMQFNKRDLPNLSSIEEMNTRINRHNAPFYEAVAMTGIGVEDTLKAVTKLVLNNLSAKYRLEDGAGAAQKSDPPAEVPRAADSASRRAQARPAATPDHHAIDLDDDETISGPPPATTPAPTPAAASIEAAPAEDVIELVDELPAEDAGSDLPDLDAPSPAMFHSPAATVTMHPASFRAPSHRDAPAAARASSRSGALAVERAPLDADDPIDLGEPIDEDLPQPATPDPLDIGALAPGEEREIEVPVSVQLDGRTIQIHLKLKVRLTG